MPSQAPLSADLQLPPADSALSRTTPSPHLAPTTADPQPISTADFLPSFVPASDSRFTWGECDSSTFIPLLDSVYQEVIHWKRNSFSIPRGNSGKAFVNELARLFSAFANGSALERVAFKATIVLPLLVLQKPLWISKPKDHATLLERRLQLWEQGNLRELLNAGRVLQKRIAVEVHHSSDNNDRLAHSFAKLMFQGKTQAALQLLCD